jgi:hypothetical protein
VPWGLCAHVRLIYPSRDNAMAACASDTREKAQVQGELGMYILEVCMPVAAAAVDGGYPSRS